MDIFVVAEKYDHNPEFELNQEFNTVGMNDENFIGYRTKLEEINYKIIKKLMKVSIFCSVFMTIEFVGGWIADH